MNYFKVVVVLALFILNPILVTAHGLATAKTQIVGKYLLEFEYDRLGDIQADEFMLYNVDIIDTTTNQAVKFDRAYIKIAKENTQNAVLVTDIYPTTLMGGIIGGRVGGVITEPGDYKVILNFYKDNQEIAGAIFDHKIVPVSIYSTTAGANNYLWIVALIVGLIGGMGLNKLLNHKSNLSHS